MDNGTESGFFLYSQQRNHGLPQPLASLRRKPLNRYIHLRSQGPPRNTSTGGQYHSVNHIGRQDRREPSRNTSVTLTSISEARSSRENARRNSIQHRILTRDAPTQPYDQSLLLEDASTTLNNESNDTSQGDSESKRSTAGNSPYDWKPWLLHNIGLFISCLFGHILIYAVGRYFTVRNGIIVRSASDNYWFFRFAPSFLAVFVKEWCSRLTADYQSIHAFFPQNLRNQEHPKSFVRRLFCSSRLYTTGIAGSTTGLTVFDVVGFTASLLVIIQSTILVEVLVTRAATAHFTVVDHQDFLNVFKTSMLPALTVPSYFMNQSYPSPWLTEASSEFGLLATQVGALPFKQKSPSTNIESSTCLTSGYATSLQCNSILKPSVRMKSVESSRWDVFVTLNDSNGCEFQGIFTDVSLTGSQNFATGAVGNNTFAIWRYLEDTINTAKPRASCSPTTQFILAGQIPAKSLPNATNYVNTTALDNGWTALSCSSQYISFNDNLRLTVHTNRSPSTTDVNVGANAAAVNSTLAQAFDRTMRKNFLDTGIIAMLGGWYTGKTFWNTAAENAWSGVQFSNNGSNLCAPGSTLISTYRNSGACDMYVNLQTLWPLIFSLSVPSVASSVPENSWNKARGQTVSQEYGWAVSEGALYISVALHALIISLIITTRMLHLPRFLPYFMQRHLGHRKTGLIHSPATIVAKAELFSDHRIRDLFTGIDALQHKEANTELRYRIAPLKFRTSTQEISSDIEPHRAVGVSALLSLDPHSAMPPEYDAIKQLPEDEQELARLRFRYLPVLLRLSALIFASFILCIIFAGFVYMTQNERGYYFWTEAFSEGHSWSLWAQQFAFSITPIIVILILRWWWMNIDTFFRISQPYVGLFYSMPGKESVCLSYINDIDIIAMLRSLTNKHFHLTFVTTVALLIKLALVLAGGLFCFQSGSSRHITNLQPLQAWRNNTFQATANSFDDVTRHSLVLSSMSEYSQPDYGLWQKDMFIFTPVAIQDHGVFQMQLSGLSADLDCREVTTESGFSGNSLTATLDIDGCDKISWQDFCRFPGYGSNSGSYTALAWNSLSKSSSSTSASISMSTTSVSASTTGLSANSTSTFSSITSSVIGSNYTSSITTVTSTTTTTLDFAHTTATLRVLVPAPSPTMPGTTSQCYSWYTPQPGDYCWEIAQADGMDWEVLRVLNPSIDADCHNLQPYKSYCVDGISPSARRRNRRDMTSNAGTCTGWKYIESAACNASGKWWIVSARGSTIQTGSAASQGLSAVSQSTSLICEPRFWMNQVDVTVSNDVDAKAWNLTVGQIQSSMQLKSDNWVQAGNSSLSFSDYFSAGLQKYGFAGTFYDISDTIFLDILSLVAASNSTDLTSAFQDSDQMGQLASTAFARAFVKVASRSVSPDGSTILSQSATSSSSQPVQAYKVIFNAVPSKVPLYALLVIIAFCVISIGFVYPDKSRRMAADPTVIANVVTSIYASSVISKVKHAIEQGKSPAEELKNIPFSYGVYYGETTRVRRLGIDSSDKMIEHVQDPKQNASSFHHLRRTFTSIQRRTRGTEKDRLDQDNDMDVPYLAQYHDPQELGASPVNSNPYQRPTRRYTLSGFEPRHHGMAEETSYPPPRRSRTYDHPELPQLQPEEPVPVVARLSRTQTLKSKIGTVLDSARRAGQSDALLEEDDVVVQPPASVSETEAFDDRTRRYRDGEAGLFAVTKKYAREAITKARNMNRTGYTAPDTEVPRPRGYMEWFSNWKNR